MLGKSLVTSGKRHNVTDRLLRFCKRGLKASLKKNIVHELQSELLQEENENQSKFFLGFTGKPEVC